MSGRPQADEDREVTTARRDDHRAGDGSDRVVSRRRVLGVATTAITGAIAGCTGGDGGGDSGDGDGDSGDGGGNSEDGSTTGVVESVEVLPGGEVRVTLSSAENVDSAAILQPEGEDEEGNTGGSEMFRDEFSGTEFTLSVENRNQNDIVAGEYTLYVGTDMDDPPYEDTAEGSATFTVRREVQITDVSTTRLSNDRSSPWDLGIVVTYENVGHLPVNPSFVELEGSITETTRLVGEESASPVDPGETESTQLEHSKRSGESGYTFEPGDGDGEPSCDGSGEVTVSLTRGAFSPGGPFSEVTATVSLGGELTKVEYYGTYNSFVCSEVTFESVTDADAGSS